MKKLIVIFLLLSFYSTPAFARINIVTTIPDFASIAKEVGGDLVSVKSLLRSNQDPHYIEPKPSYASSMNKADLFIAVGLELEIGWVPVLLTQSRNPKIQRGQKGYLEPWQGIHILDIPKGKIDRSHGDIHPDGNPHYWLDPRNGVLIANNIAKRLGRLDPKNSSVYLANAQKFSKNLQTKIASWQRSLAGLKGKSVITHHQSFTYFAHWAGVKIVDRIEDKPGIPPSPTHMIALIKLIKAQKVPLIITEHYYNPKPSEKLKKQTGISVVYVPTSAPDYFELFNALANKLKGSL
jgi:zinc/manganese transport system substrate-binding protein